MNQESTQTLLLRASQGDDAARENLVVRFRPVLSNWAHGRLPAYARSLSDTDDLVQITLVSALNHLESFKPEREGAFLAYLRTILVNRIRDEIRRVKARGQSVTLDANVRDEGRSPLEAAIGAEALDRYEQALEALTDKQREACVLRLEFGYTYEMVAEATGSPSANAARMTVVRGLARLAEVMNGSR